MKTASPRRRRERAERERASAALALSALVHLLAFAYLGALGECGGRAPVAATPVAVVPVSPSEFARRREIAVAPAPAPPAPREEESQREKEKLARGRVVDVAPTPGATAPDDARFLAEKNARAEKETVSRDQSLRYRNAQPRPSQSLLKEPPPDAAQEPRKLPPVMALLDPGAQPGGAAPRKGAPAVEVPRVQQRDELRLAVDPELGELVNRGRVDKVRGNSRRLRLSLGEPEAADAPPDERPPAPGTGPGLAALLPRGAPYDPLDGAPAPDHLPEVEEGDATFLNAAEFKYATFFNRVKQGVGERWRPGDALGVRDPSGRIYGSRDRYTVLSVTLDAAGALKDVWVDESSGLDFLDSEAVGAFRRAQPFPNPPRGLLNEDGEIRFAFGFFVEMGAGPRIRVFRQTY